MLFDSDIDWVSTDSCYVVSFASEDLIERSSLRLQNGEDLLPGDEVVKLGRKGCSYRQPIRLAKGWVQRYEGFIQVNGESEGVISHLALFTALHRESGALATDDFHMKHLSKFLGYHQYEDLSLGYWAANKAYNFFKTDYLVRA